MHAKKLLLFLLHEVKIASTTYHYCVLATWGWRIIDLPRIANVFIHRHWDGIKWKHPTHRELILEGRRWVAIHWWCGCHQNNLLGPLLDRFVQLLAISSTMCFVHHKYCCWFSLYPKMKITHWSCMKQQLPTIDFPTATITAHYDITGQKAVGKPFGMSSFSLNISCSVKCDLSPNNFDLIGKKGWIASQKRILCYSKWSNGLHRLSLLMFFW